MNDFSIELGQTPPAPMRVAVRGTESENRRGLDPKKPMSAKERLRLENQENWKRLEEVEQRRLKNLARLKSESSDRCTVMGGRTRRNKKARRKGITRRNKKARRKGITRRNKKPRRNRIYRK